MRLLPLLAGALYVIGARRAGRWPVLRIFSFVAGTVIVVVATAGPLDAVAHERLSAHMWQHLLLTLVAAPLVVLGAPVTLALRSWPGGRRSISAVLHSLPARLVAHPFFTWSFFAVVMWLTHFTGFYAAALRNEGLHLVQHFLYLTAGLFFWSPVIAADPAPRRLSRPGRVGYLVAALPLQSFLGVAIYSQSSPLYEPYGLSAAALADQRTAGMVMWLAGDALILAGIVAATVAWLRAEEKSQMTTA